MGRVVLIQRYVPHYRQAFFEKLYEQLKIRNVELVVVYGQGHSNDARKKDAVMLSFGHIVKLIPIEGLFWQNAISYVQSGDLVIVEQANRLLFNYYILLRRLLKRDIKFAFWGHGVNRQSSENSLGNRIKRILVNSSDWWFAYTDGIKRELVAQGVSSNIITSVQNTIDVDALIHTTNAINLPEDRQSSDGLSKIGIFVGGMNPEKDIPYVIQVCKLVKQMVPKFKMFFIGSGVHQSLVDEFAANNSWVISLGSLFGKDKLFYLKLADVLLMPSAVGLIVIDSFITQTPIITRDRRGHGPEIEYIKHNANGLICHHEGYVNSIVNALTTPSLLEELKNGCRESVSKYSLDTMVARFTEGILSILNENTTGS